MGIAKLKVPAHPPLLVSSDRSLIHPKREGLAQSVVTNPGLFSRAQKRDGKRAGGFPASQCWKEVILMDVPGMLILKHQVSLLSATTQSDAAARGAGAGPVLRLAGRTSGMQICLNPGGTQTQQRTEAFSTNPTLPVFE